MPDLDNYSSLNPSIDTLKHHSPLNQTTTHNFSTIVTESNIRDSLLYFLLGFDTTNICEDEDEGFVINPSYTNQSLIFPFTNLIFSHRKLIRFIKKMNYGCSDIKSVIREYLILRVDVYQKTILNLFKCDIEKVFVRISHYIEEFKEYGDLVESIEDLEGIAIFNIILSKYERGFLYYEGIIDEMKCIINKDVLKWCCHGESGNNGIIVENKSPLAFNESYFKNAFDLCDKIPKFLQSHDKKIYECGLMKNIMRKLNDCEESSTLLSMNCNTDLDNIYFRIKGIYGNSVGVQIKKYILEIYNNYFIRDNSWIIDLFSTLGNKVFMDFDSAASEFSKIFSKYEFKKADSRINHFIIQILSTDKYTENNRVNIFENLLIVNSNELFHIFFSKKVIFELELIFRFLYQLYVFEYFFTRIEKNNFVIKARTFLQYFRSTIFLNYIDTFQQVLESSEQDLVTKFEEFIRYILKQLYFTQMTIFKIVSEIFDIFFEYVYVKGDDGVYLRAFDENLRKMKSELEKSGSTPEFLFYIDIMKC